MAPDEVFGERARQGGEELVARRFRAQLGTDPRYLARPFRREHILTIQQHPHNRIVRHPAVATLLAICLLLAACGGEDETGSSGDEAGSTQTESGGEEASTYPIGGVLSVTGPLAPLGETLKLGIEFGIEDLNAQGLIEHPLEIEFVDPRSQEDRAVALTNRMAEGDSLALIGYTGSSLALAAKPVVNRAEVVQLANAVSDEIQDPVEPYTFAMSTSGYDSLTTVMELLDNQGVERVALLYEDTAFSVGSVRGVQEGAAAAGIEIVAEESFLPEERELGVPVSNALSGNPDVIIGIVISDTAAAITRALDQQGADDTTVIWNTGPVTPDYIELVGESGEGQLGLSLGLSNILEDLPADDPRRERYEALNEAFMEHAGEPLSLFSSLGYDQVAIIVEAIRMVEAAGDPVTRLTIRDAIEAMEGFEGITGTYTFGPDQHRGAESATNIVQLRDGEWRLYLAAEEIAEGIVEPPASRR